MSEKTILVVEPEPQIARRIMVCLEGAGYRVVTASDEQDALRRIKEQSFALLLIDDWLNMMTGDQLAQHLSETMQETLPPILLMIDKHIANGFQFGAWYGVPHHFITMPFNPEELLTFVRRIFASADAQ